MAIDSNNSRFRHLLGKADWAVSSDSDTLAWDERVGALALREVAYEFPAPGDDTPLAAEARRGASRDRYGNTFWINEARDGIRMADVDGKLHDWWPAAPQQDTEKPAGAFGPAQPAEALPAWQIRGMCVTSEHYLLVGVRAAPVGAWSGLLLFDLHAGGIAQELRWPQAVMFEPRDLCASADGGVWVLDDADQGRLWRLNRAMQVCRLGGLSEASEVRPAQMADFAPLTSSGDDVGVPRAMFPSPFELRDSAAQPLAGARAIEAIRDDGVLVLDSPADAEGSRVLWLSWPNDGDAPDLREAALDSRAAHTDSSRSHPLKAHDFVHIPGPDNSWGRLYVDSSSGNQVYEFLPDFGIDDKGLSLLPQVSYYPLFWHFGRQLIAAAPPTPDNPAINAGDPIEAMYTDVYYDHGERWLPLVAQRKPSFEAGGELITRVLDGESHDCVWHRLVFDADIPAETGVRIESRCANDEDELDDLAWRQEPLPYRRAIGSEIPGHEAFRHDGCAPPQDAASWELLLQAASGRFLQLRLTLTGNGRRTPRIRSLRAWFPRFSYLHEYLPAVYRQDGDAASFLARYLANVEGLFTTWEDRIASAQLLMDAQTAPAEFLDWLAGWLGLSLDASWDTERRRLLLRYASRLFRQRGTVAGMVRSLRLALDDCPDASLFEADVIGGVQPVRVVESFSQRAAPRVDLKTVSGTNPLAPDGERSGATGSASSTGYPDIASLRPYVQAAWEVWVAEFELGAANLFPATLPTDASVAAVWRRFLREELCFEYAPVDAANADDLRAWQRFLSHRHGRLEQIAAAYGLDSASVAALVMPHTLPEAGPRFDDWIRFVSAYLPAHRAAHRFTVLVPTPPTIDEQGLNDWFSRVEAVVRQSMPAHTTFAVQVYSGLCRVGVARVGLDTVLEKGARDRRHGIGSAVLGDARLEASYPNDLTDRRVLTRSAGCAQF